MKFESVLMKGGIMSLVVEGINNKFVFLDIKKMIVCSTLKKLCTSFKVPERYTKGEIDHNYTKDTWE